VLFGLSVEKTVIHRNSVRIC